MGKMKTPTPFRRRSSSKLQISPASHAQVKDLRLAFTPAGLASLLHSLGQKATVSQCQRMIASVDKNGDGLLSYEEFKVMMVEGGFPANMRKPIDQSSFFD